MKFNNLDGAMRAYEQSLDMYVAPNMYMVMTAMDIMVEDLKFQ